MKKSDFWRRIWIPIRKSIPPLSDRKVAVWNPIWNNNQGEAFVIESYIAHHTAQKILDGETNISSDRFFTHWYLIEGPGK